MAGAWTKLVTLAELKDAKPNMEIDPIVYSMIALGNRLLY